MKKGYHACEELKQCHVKCLLMLSFSMFRDPLCTLKNMQSGSKMPAFILVDRPTATPVWHLTYIPTAVLRQSKGAVQ